MLESDIFFKNEEATRQIEILHQAGNVAAIAGCFERSVRLLALLRQATPDTLRRLLLQFSDDEGLQEIVATRWADLDPQGMAAFVDNERNRFGYAIDEALFLTWAASDPDAAWEYAAKNQGKWNFGERGGMVIDACSLEVVMRLLAKHPDLDHGRAGTEWAENDLARAVPMLAASPNGFLRGNTLSDLIGDWV
ncbi:MAG: hypothetical protein ACI9R3_003018 [Verrucomicrobiales bacterium]|jgi:hypothetical protein